MDAAGSAPAKTVAELRANGLWAPEKTVAGLWAGFSAETNMSNIKSNFSILMGVTPKLKKKPLRLSCLYDMGSWVGGSSDKAKDKNRTHVSEA